MQHSFTVSARAKAHLKKIRENTTQKTFETTRSQVGSKIYRDVLKQPMNEENKKEVKLDRPRNLFSCGQT